MKAHNTIPYLLVAAALLLGGCSSPEESARAALVEAGEAWQQALGRGDPVDRVTAYTEVIDAVAEIAVDYPETPDGRAVAGGAGVVNGLSLGTMRSVRDELATRAVCYSKPTIACLTSYASGYVREAAANSGSAEAVFAEAAETVCAHGFTAAEQKLEAFRINKGVYADQLVQLALAAAACDKPDEVRTAIAAYSKAMPETGAARASALLRIVSTDELKPAWPPVLAELEQGLPSGALPANVAASVALTLSLRYAELGDADAAMKKYRYFTDTLRYEADWQSKLELGSSLIVAGATAEGLSVVENKNVRSFSVITVSQAAAKVGQDAGVLRQGYPQPQLYGVKSIGEFLAPTDGADRKRIAAAAATVEAELDKLAPVVTVQDSAITQIDVAYGTLALVQQKLGDSGKADAVLQKGRAFRGRLLASGAENVGLEQFNTFATLIALGQGKHADAAELVQAVRARSDYTRLILQSFAAKGDLEQCLALANTIDNNIRAQYTTVIESLIQAGRLDDADRAIAAYTGNADEKRFMYWQLVTQAAAQGDVKRAEKLANNYQLVNTPQDRLRLLSTYMNSEKVAGDRGDAEPIIREIFTIGSQLDGSAGGSRYDSNNNLVAQNAAWQAFHCGYTDLGIELYQAAARKDQRPLLEAFNDKLKQRDMTPLLMLAHDNLRGAELGYVIDAAIRYLNREAA